MKILACPLVLDQPGRRARSSASRNVVQSATRAACCRLPVDQAIPPLLDQAATWRQQTAAQQPREPRGPPRQLCTAMGSAPLAVAELGPGRSIRAWPRCDLWQRVLR
jgi:hypothetical protein